jgi:hypothetical protein
MLTNFRVTALITAAVVLGGCATSTTKPIASTGATNNPNCLTSTGSRIPVTGTDCSSTGRSYSNQDLQRTGATSVAGALPLMDPSLTIVQH